MKFASSAMKKGFKIPKNTFCTTKFAFYSTKGFRVEKDTMGELEVPNDKYWGCQTQRS